MGDLDLPYEEMSGELLDEHVHYSGGVVVMGAVIPTEERLPALVFRFAKPDGSGFYPPILLAMSPEQLRNIVALIETATASACKAAS